MGRRDHRRLRRRHPQARPRDWRPSSRWAIRIGVALERHYGGGQTIRAVLVHSGPDRRVAPCRRRRHAVPGLGAPLQVRRDVPARSHPRGDPRGQQPADRSRAHRRDEARPADHVDDVLELQSGHAGARDRQDRQGADARGSVPGLGRALHLRHRVLRRHPAARHRWARRWRT